MTKLAKAMVASRAAVRSRAEAYRTAAAARRRRTPASIKLAISAACQYVRAADATAAAWGAARGNDCTGATLWRRESQLAARRAFDLMSITTTTTETKEQGT